DAKGKTPLPRVRRRRATHSGGSPGSAENKTTAPTRVSAILDDALASSPIEELAAEVTVEDEHVKERMGKKKSSSSLTGLLGLPSSKVQPGEGEVGGGEEVVAHGDKQGTRDDGTSEPLSPASKAASESFISSLFSKSPLFGESGVGTEGVGVSGDEKVTDTAATTAVAGDTKSDTSSSSSGSDSGESADEGKEQKDLTLSLGEEELASASEAPPSVVGHPSSLSSLVDVSASSSLSSSAASIISSMSSASTTLVASSATPPSGTGKEKKPKQRAWSWFVGLLGSKAKKDKSLSVVPAVATDMGDGTLNPNDDDPLSAALAANGDRGAGGVGRAGLDEFVNPNGPLSEWDLQNIYPADKAEIHLNGFARYPLHVEKTIYRMSHGKLAQHRRPLCQQVLISNLMLYILSVHADVTLNRQGPRAHGRKGRKGRKRSRSPSAGTAGAGATGTIGADKGDGAGSRPAGGGKRTPGHANRNNNNSHAAAQSGSAAANGGNAGGAMVVDGAGGAGGMGVLPVPSMLLPQPLPPPNQVGPGGGLYLMNHPAGIIAVPAGLPSAGPMGGFNGMPYTPGAGGDESDPRRQRNLQHLAMIKDPHAPPSGGVVAATTPSDSTGGWLGMGLGGAGIGEETNGVGHRPGTDMDIWTRTAMDSNGQGNNENEDGDGDEDEDDVPLGVLKVRRGSISSIHTV
ncbi:hypothetical protein HK102_006922, partial [Quaeritorhiza haematococci]